jgi:hypothetical protein
VKIKPIIGDVERKLGLARALKEAVVNAQGKVLGAVEAVRAAEGTILLLRVGIEAAEGEVRVCA